MDVDEEPFCDVCAHLGSTLGKTFGYNHLVDDCLRCPNSWCARWQMTEEGYKTHASICGVKQQPQQPQQPPPQQQPLQQLQQQPQRMRRPVIERCAFWFRGGRGCLKGDVCPFRHSNDESVVSELERTGNMVCRVCNVRGHHQINCPTPTMCGHCSSALHQTDRCYECYNCGEWGHRSFQCTTRGKNKVPMCNTGK